MPRHRRIILTFGLPLFIAITVGAVEGGALIRMLARIMIKRAEQRALEKGMEKGLAMANRKWRAWLRRREIAEAEGREFNEPPPSLDDE